jgi:hypothetical protein
LVGGGDVCEVANCGRGRDKEGKGKGKVKVKVKVKGKVKGTTIPCESSPSLSRPHVNVNAGSPHSAVTTDTAQHNTSQQPPTTDWVSDFPLRQCMNVNPP